MKRVALFALVALVLGGFTLSSCKAAGESATKASGTSAKKEKVSKASSKSGDGCHLKAGDITFKYIPGEDEEPEEVYLAGSFNGWNPSDPNYQLEQNDDGSFSITVELDPGKYLFKFVIDGTWIQSMEDYEGKFSPAACSYVDDGFGGKNAVIEVEE